MQSPGRSQKASADDQPMLPTAVKVAMVVCCLVGAAVTLRWSWNPPKFVLVHPFRVRLVHAACCGTDCCGAHTSCASLVSPVLMLAASCTTLRTLEVSGTARCRRVERYDPGRWRGRRRHTPLPTPWSMSATGPPCKSTRSLRSLPSCRLPRRRRRRGGQSASKW